jgi:hypothetical protein
MCLFFLKFDVEREEVERKCHSVGQPASTWLVTFISISVSSIKQQLSKNTGQPYLVLTYSLLRHLRGSTVMNTKKNG